MESFKYLLVIGGTGELGSSIVKVFKNNNSNWKICVIDYRENTDADINIIINPSDKHDEIFLKKLYSNIEEFSKVYHAIFTVAGGWMRGSLKSINIFKHSEEMFNKNYFSSLLAAHLATKYLVEAGLIIFTGAAKVFKDPAPDMLAYQVAKTATHSLSWSLKDCTDLPNDTFIITILPEIIDTPQNRENMPLEDFSKWTKPEGIAALLKMWADGFNRPKSGSFAILKNKDNYVIPEFV